ncbi:hypothetical protein BTO06_12155 [Tenacibaculum sp. SZ-18]|uniref:hypothetical protein n=1 Tax=Tenacibaculum sp. SZ-18 TaxID=754423 RepID=UPI000C2D3BBF|nr:hypothetical protein [Tenacibaculum sp. SZ-18]AUC15857.1 hypothetical protein BTO06_12155 [Tenacibaculum sp. SZ-18]
MKKITFILISLITLTNCGVKKKIMLEQKNENFKESTHYNVILPENWKPILDSHDLLGYSPKNLKDINKNIVRIYELKLTGNKESSLNNFVQEDVERLNNIVKIDSQKLSKESTKYGETYRFEYEHNWNFKHYKKTFFYFKHSDFIYKFSYSSEIKYYKNYENDAIFIFNNLEFKKKQK